MTWSLFFALVAVVNAVLFIIVILIEYLSERRW